MKDDDDIELWDIKTVCQFFGGSGGKPLHASTIYRGMNANPPRFPRPVDITPNVKRWVGSECREALRLLATHDKTKPASKRGRPKKADKPAAVEAPAPPKKPAKRAQKQAAR